MQAQLDYKKFQNKLEECKCYKDELEKQRLLFNKIVFEWNTVADIDFSLVNEEILEKFINDIDYFWDRGSEYENIISKVITALSRCKRATCSRRLI